MAKVSMNQAETYEFLISHYKEDLKSEMITLLEKLPSKEESEEFFNAYHNVLDIELNRQIEFKYPGLLEAFKVFDKKHNVEKEDYFGKDDVNLFYRDLEDGGYSWNCFETPSQIEFSARRGDDHLGCTLHVDRNAEIKRIVKEVKKINKMYSSTVDQIKNLQRKLSEAVDNKPLFRAKFKERIMLDTKIGRKVIKELKSINLVRMMSANGK